MMDDRGPLDLTKQIDDLKENKEALEGKVKFLQETCRRAGAQIKKLESELKKANQWKEDEVEKFRDRLRDTTSYEKRQRDYTEQ
jgi:peptidoglycan hydrolase CwlO-like protein